MNSLLNTHDLVIYPLVQSGVLHGIESWPARLMNPVGPLITFAKIGFHLDAVQREKQDWRDFNRNLYSVLDCREIKVGMGEDESCQIN